MMCSAVLNEMEDEEASLIRKKNSVLLTIMKQIYFGRNSKRDFPLSSLKSKRFCLFLFLYASSHCWVSGECVLFLHFCWVHIRALLLLMPIMSDPLLNGHGHCALNHFATLHLSFAAFIVCSKAVSTFFSVAVAAEDLVGAGLTEKWLMTIIVPVWMGSVSPTNLFCSCLLEKQRSWLH